jgi:hypothetical protein
MSLNKPIKTPGDEIPLSHHRFEKISRLDHLARIAEFNIHGHMTQTTAGNLNAKGVIVGVMTLQGPAFDYYFSRQAIATAHTAGIDLYGQVYVAIKDWTAAEMVRRAIEQEKVKYMGAKETFGEDTRSYSMLLTRWRLNKREKPDNTDPEPVKPVEPVPPSLPPLTVSQGMLTTYGSISGLLGGDIFDGATDA